MRLAGIVAGRYRAAIGGVVLAPTRALARLRIRQPERLLISPQDIRTADATRAEDIYAGYFVFSGKVVNTHGVSPFELPPPSPLWSLPLPQPANNTIPQTNTPKARNLLTYFCIIFIIAKTKIQTTIIYI